MIMIIIISRTPSGSTIMIMIIMIIISRMPFRSKNNDNNSQDALWVNLKEEEELLVSDQVVAISPDYGPVKPVSISFYV